jgi:hypothetical protein
VNPWVVRLDGLEQNYDVDITRRGKWGNPFVIGIHGTRSQVIKLHRDWINGRVLGPNGEVPPTRQEIVTELKGKRLGCHCHPKSCHGDTLAEIANQPQRKGLFSRLA